MRLWEISWETEKQKRWSRQVGGFEEGQIETNQIYKSRRSVTGIFVSFITGKWRLTEIVLRLAA